MEESKTIAKNLKQVQSRFSAALKEAKREKEEVKLIAVSKKKPYSLLEACFNLGQEYFAENYIQEGVEKFTKLKELAATNNSFLETHFIGHLQRNKVKVALEVFDVIQTVDSLKLAEKIANEASKISKQQNILLQVNISNEESKSGISTKELPELIDFAVSAKDSLKLQGLMAIGSPKSRNQKGEFEALGYLLKREAERTSSEFKELSMGMSQDLEEAILYGSTMIRVGTAIFGARD